MSPRFLLTGLLSSVALVSLEAAPRTWTSKDGAATLTATFHKIEGDKVVLTLPNGRSQIVARSFLSEADLAWIVQNGTPDPTGTAASDGAKPTDPIPAALRGNLIDASGRPVKLAAGGTAPRHYLFYYSASWCPPCRAFTPEIVRFANRMKSESFSVILVSNDRSLEDEIAYLKDYKMPWPAIKFGALPAGIPDNPGNGIPAARLTDAQGKTLLTTEDVGRDDFLDGVRKIISRPDSATAAHTSTTR